MVSVTLIGEAGLSAAFTFETFIRTSRGEGFGMLSLARYVDNVEAELINNRQVIGRDRTGFRIVHPTRMERLQRYLLVCAHQDDRAENLWERCPALSPKKQERKRSL